tara:strand:- start:736 stop:1065 length:330 start_codon:yes stop_codon:yes gene_type:complete
MTNIIELEKGLFSNLQSEFSKFINILERHPDNSESYPESYPDALYLKKIIVLNEQMRLLENMIYELKIDKIKNLKCDDKNDELLVDYDKDKKVLDYFKPFMLYYRFLLE